MKLRLLWPVERGKHRGCPSWIRHCNIKKYLVICKSRNANPIGRRAYFFFGNCFAENCIKMKESGLKGNVPSFSLDLPLNVVCPFSCHFRVIVGEKNYLIYRFADPGSATNNANSVFPLRICSHWSMRASDRKINWRG